MAGLGTAFWAKKKKKAGGAGAVQIEHKALGDRVCVQDSLGPVPGQGVQPGRYQSPTGTTHCPGRAVSSGDS